MGLISKHSVKAIAAIALLIIVSSLSCTKIESPQKTSEFMQLSVIGQNELIAGTTSSMRVICFDERGLKPLKDVNITATLALSGKNDRIELFKGSTDAEGTLSMAYPVRKDIAGSGNVEVTARTGGGERKQSFPVTVKEREPKISLSTDKPIYQPGQTIHIKALALLIPSLEPLAKEKFDIEVIDPKGNKVMKSEQDTSQYGIASCDFALANEINMGEYTVKVTGPRETATKKVLVKKYVLPKFKASMETDKKYYQAGDKIEGAVNARYFFGKPTANADVIINVIIQDERIQKAGVLKGKTNKDGYYKFSYVIPRTFGSSAYEQNKAAVQLEANVLDGTGHKETVMHQYPVSKYPITVQVMPEGGRLVTALENNVYILTSYPDGTPAECSLEVSARGNDRRTLATDSTGYAVMPVIPKAGEYLTLMVGARDRKGNTADKTSQFNADMKTENVLLRTDKSLYINGDVVKVKVLSTQKDGIAYIDVIRNGMTAFTKAVAIKDGQGETFFDIPKELSGVVTFNAYFVSPYTGVVKDSRTIYVAPQDINIAVKLDRDSYRPGEEAKLEFALTDRKGNATPGAVGVDVVDESLFALFERKPGMEKVFFLVPDQLLHAPYMMYTANLGDFIQTSQEPRSDIFARVVLAQAPQMPPYSLRQDTYLEKEQKILDALEKIGTAADRYRGEKQKSPATVKELVSANMLSTQESVDPWGQEFVIKQPQQAGQTPVAVKPLPPPHRKFDKEIMPDIEPGPNAGLALRRPPGWDMPVAYAASWDESRNNVLCLGGDGKEGTPDDLDLRSLMLTRGPASQPKYDEELAVKGGPMPQMAPGGMANMAREQEGAMKMKADMAAGPPMPSAAAQAPQKAALTGTVEPAKTREFFPETLLSKPEIITDDKGIATLTVPLADSITTWRLAVLANTLKGQLGSTSTGIKVFQDFFIDLDLPVKLTQGDEISIPVAVYNYLPNDQEIEIVMDKASWFEVMGSHTQRMKVKKEDVTSHSFRIKVKDVGIHKFDVTARGTSMSDALTRKIEVEPDGKKYIVCKGDILKAPGGGTEVEIPGNAIAGGSNILLTVYPRPYSQILEGMDNIFAMPNGCFEQTSSATYPDVLVLDYLKKTGQSNAEVEKKALAYISSGYQRLLSYEINGGGFQVWGTPPATKVLSAYGLMEFSDMSKVSKVDPAVLERTKRWLLSKREPDGSWTPDVSYAHAEQWGTIQSHNIPVTAYITWAMAESGCKNEITESINYLKRNAGQIQNPYILALCANAFLTVNPSDADGIKILEKLNGLKVQEKDTVCWKSDSLYSQGLPASVETTALIIYGMLKAKMTPDTVTAGLNFLAKSKDSNGLWHSTQATIFAMRALLLSQTSSPEKVDLAADVLVNGEKVESFKVNEANKDVFQQFDLKKYVKSGRNDIKIDMKGQGSCSYRVAGLYYLPWVKEETAGKKELSIQVGYNKTEVKTQDSVTCNVDVKNLRPNDVPMVMVEVGTPPGFVVEKEDIDKLVTAKKVSKYEMTGTKVVLYLDGLRKGKSFKGSYRLMARFPLKAKVPVSMTYLYYNPEVNAVCQPATLKVL